jgi:hypothetical protein
VKPPPRTKISSEVDLREQKDHVNPTSDLQKECAVGGEECAVGGEGFDVWVGASDFENELLGVGAGAEVRNVLSGVRVLMFQFHRVIPGDTRKHHFFARPEISRLNRDEIWQAEWCTWFSSIHSITSAGPFSFPVLHRFRAALQTKASGGASEEYRSNRGEITGSECSMWSSGTTGISLEYSGTSAVRCWGHTDPPNMVGILSDTP